MSIQRVTLWALLGCLSSCCTPDLDELSAKFYAGAAGMAAGQGGSESASGGTSDGGLLGAGGTRPGTGGARNGSGGARPGAGGAAHGGTASGSAPGAGSPNAGDTLGQGGEGGSGGEQPSGLGGASAGGTLGQGGRSSSGGTTATGGTTALGGATCVDSGATNVVPPSSISCIDGCALLYIPFATGCSTSPFFTINLDLVNGVDLSTAVITAKVRALNYTGTSESIRFYASALPNYAFFAAGSVPISGLVNGGTLTMDLTTTPGWDHTKVMSFGFNLSGSSNSSTVWLLVEEITISGSATVGPWLFRGAADVNDSSNVAGTYSIPNILFANNYNHLPGQKAIWVPPSDGGAGGAGGAN